jgi:hypothetical protein
VLFYSQPEPLSRDLHGKIGLRRIDKPYGFAAGTNVVPLTVGEFPLAALCYPIIFAGDRHQPLAVLGINQGLNQFVDEAGAYQIGAYIPAYIRRYPFVLANDQSGGRLVVCIDRAAPMLGEDYELAFFDEKGEATEYTNNCMKFCNDFEAENRRTESFVSMLKLMDLFEPRRAAFTPTNPDGTQGEPQPLAEFFAISEEKVRGLAADKIKELLDNGALPQIYAHLMSLAQWDRLVAVAASRQLLPAPETAPTPANVN